MPASRVYISVVIMIFYHKHPSVANFCDFENNKNIMKNCFSQILTLLSVPDKSLPGAKIWKQTPEVGQDFGANPGVCATGL